MKIIIFFLLITSLSLFANTFEEANKLYTSKQFDKALAIYLELAQKNEPTANLYYNIGNCYYRLNELGHAIVYYEKAYKLNPDDESIQKNLKIANAKTIDKITPVSKLFIYKWIDDLTQLNSPTLFAVWSIVFIWFSVGFAILFFVTRKSSTRKLSFYSSAFLFVMFIITLWLGFNSENYHKQTHNGIIIAKSVYVKSSPDASSTDLFILHEGTKFEIKDNVSDWFQIRLANGATGWIEEKHFGKI